MPMLPDGTMLPYGPKGGGPIVDPARPRPLGQPPGAAMDPRFAPQASSQPSPAAQIMPGAPQPAGGMGGPGGKPAAMAQLKPSIPSLPAAQLKSGIPRLNKQAGQQPPAPEAAAAPSGQLPPAVAAQLMQRLAPTAGRY